jgi:serine phosphatase RsbU (regulator of sigma subunit)
MAAGLTTGFAFPVEHDGAIVGVIEMFRRAERPIDPELPDVLADIGGHLGPYLAQLRRHERRRRGEARLRLLTTSIERLSRWLDFPAPLDQVCRLLVPEVADACVVDLLEAGALTRRGSAYVDESYRSAVEALDRHLRPETLDAGPARVARTGATVTYRSVGADTLAAAAPDGLPDDVLARLTPASTVIVPLVGRGATIGVLSMARRGIPFDDDEVRFAEELGRHIGLAVANAALFEREHAIAAALQQSLLPPRLPAVPGLEMAGRYEPGGSGLAVGGDFYDVFAVGPDRWFAVVGDVCGTGAEAAAITSQVRYTTRALAGRVATPAALLGEVNAALLDRGDSRFCTATVARIDRLPGSTGVEVTLASGGHPAPVHIAREGSRMVDAPGSLLGVYADAHHTDVHLHLGPRESLALYTDGVIEARDRRGALLGEDGLVDVLDACVDEPADSVAAQVVEAAVGHSAAGPTDDIAVLVIRNA